jgi:hypothetical protein
MTLLDIYISGNAARMIEGRQSSDAIFMNCFFSSEGYYSQLVFKENISVKIVGRGFDDFSTSPSVVYQRRMMRCNADIDLSTCLNITKSVDDSSTVRAHKQPSSSSAAALVPVNAYYNTEACMMFWLPKETRYC